MIRRMRKWWLCWRYKICPVHGTLLEHTGGYNGSWRCSVCEQENTAKWHFKKDRAALNRVRAQERLNRDWRLG